MGYFEAAPSYVAWDDLYPYGQAIPMSKAPQYSGSLDTYYHTHLGNLFFF